MNSQTRFMLLLIPVLITAVLCSCSSKENRNENLNEKQFTTLNRNAVGMFMLKRKYGSVPSLAERPVSTAFTDTRQTRLGRAVSPGVEAHPGRSGIYPLGAGLDAFAVRVLLAGEAERSLDIEYYIWHKDLSGTLMFDAARRAADRGVRVRLLLDDNNTSGMDEFLAALDSHPNIEIRLFNPFIVRNPRIVNYLFDFSRINRRMHNKSFTVDNQVTVIGGRNVGDEYSGASKDMLFADLDVMAAGPVAGEVSKDFDRYWASGSSYPLNWVVKPVDRERIGEIAAEAREIEQSPDAKVYVSALKNTAVVEKLVQGKLALEWDSVRMVSDDPAKGLGLAAPEELLPAKMKNIVGRPASRLELVSPYFVPAGGGVDWFSGLAGSGVNVRILTNALEATDVIFVHSGYAKRRMALLQNGVKIYEMKRFPSVAEKAGGPEGSSSSLHAKTFSVDGSRVFIGSFNFDPRSAKLNTEMGFVIDSPSLAGQMDALFSRGIPENTYEVRLTDTGRLIWLERRDGTIRQYNTEPGTNFLQRAAVNLMALLPIDWLL